ncbi:hypothetical protein JCM19037_3475 [Geomicrobium sp. JCM 19037]|nr:hypothetical protein JCM19037_3475 [Geomicrobium sp. JCM 19037]
MRSRASNGAKLACDRLTERMNEQHVKMFKKQPYSNWIYLCFIKRKTYEIDTMTSLSI